MCFCFLTALPRVLNLWSTPVLPDPSCFKLSPLPRYSLLLFFAGESPLFGLTAHWGQRCVWGATPCLFFLRGSTTVRPTRQWYRHITPGRAVAPSNPHNPCLHPPTPAQRRPPGYIRAPTHYVLFSCEMGILLWVAAHVEGTPVRCDAPVASCKGDYPHETPMNFSTVFAPDMSLPHTSRLPAPRLLTLPLG